MPPRDPVESARQRQASKTRQDFRTNLWALGGNLRSEPPLDSRTSCWSADHLPCLYVFPGKLGYALRFRKNAGEPWGDLSHEVWGNDTQDTPSRALHSGDRGRDRATSGSGPALACRRSLAHGRKEEPWV